MHLDVRMLSLLPEQCCGGERGQLREDTRRRLQIPTTTCLSGCPDADPHAIEAEAQSSAWPALLKTCAPPSQGSKRIFVSVSSCHTFTSPVSD